MGRLNRLQNRPDILSLQHTRHRSNIKSQSANPRQRPNRGLNVTSDTRPHTDRMNAELANHYNSSFCLRLHRQSMSRAGEFSLYGLADKPVLSTDRLLAQPVRLLVLRSLVDVKLHQLHGSLLDYAEDLLQLPLLEIFERQISHPLHPSLHALRQGRAAETDTIHDV